MTHQTISFIKSGIRIAGYVALGYSLVLAVVVLVISEMIGVLEEVGY